MDSEIGNPCPRSDLQPFLGAQHLPLDRPFVGYNTQHRTQVIRPGDRPRAYPQNNVVGVLDLTKSKIKIVWR